MRRITESDPISLGELQRLVPGRFRDMIKAVVDLRRRRDLWGINLYPQIEGPDWLEFDAMISRLALPRHPGTRCMTP